MEALVEMLGIKDKKGSLPLYTQTKKIMKKAIVLKEIPIMEKMVPEDMVGMDGIRREQLC